MRPRWTILGLIAVVFLLALGFAAARSGTYWSYRALYSGTIVALLGAIVVARCEGADRSRFAFGFAVFGSGYVLMALAPWYEWGVDAKGRDSVLRVNRWLLTSEPIAGLAEVVNDRLSPAPTLPPGPVSTEFRRAEADYFSRRTHLIGIGHLLAAWASGALGGLFASALVGRRRRPGEVDG